MAAVNSMVAVSSAAVYASQVLNQWDNAPGAIYELRNQLLSLQSVLDKAKYDHSHDDVTAKELGKVTQILSETVDLVRRYAHMTRQNTALSITSIRWKLQGREKTTRLQYELGNAVSKITLLLETGQM